MHGVTNERQQGPLVSRGTSQASGDGWRTISRVGAAPMPAEGVRITEADVECEARDHPEHAIDLIGFA